MPTIKSGVIAQVTHIANAEDPTIALFLWPWRLRPTFTGNNTNVRAVCIEDTDGEYPGNPNKSLDSFDWARLRRTNTTEKSYLNTDRPLMIGAMLASGPFVNGSVSTNRTNPRVVAATDVGTTQIGPLHLHPVYTGTANTVAGASYLTNVSGNITNVANGNPHTAAVIRVGGAEQTLCIVRHYDRANGRLYISCMDGTPYAALATASTVPITVGFRMAYFNEVNVIPNGTGQVELGGRFDPGEAGDSYILRVRIEKTGGAVADYTQGTYWCSVRPFVCGEGLLGTPYEDSGYLTDQRISLYSTSTEQLGLYFGTSTSVAGGCSGVGLDRANQRLWFITNNGTNGSILWWLYKQPETVHEVAASTGTPNDPLVGLTLTGNRPVGLDVGTDGSVYIAVGGAGANAGWVKIAPDLTVTQVRLADVGLTGAVVAGLVVDRGVARGGEDRVYLFFDDLTTNAGQVRYFSAATFGTLQTVAVAMTNGARVYVPTDLTGSRAAVAVDQINGKVYWASSDGGQQLNVYDPVGVAWERRLLSDFNGLNGGTGTIVNPTVINGIGVNTHADFREVWLATNAGHVKLDATNIAGAFSRYYGHGGEATPYVKDGWARPDGSPVDGRNTRIFRAYQFGLDGRVYALAQAATNGCEIAAYNRDSDFWAPGWRTTSAFGSTGIYTGFMLDPYGRGVVINPSVRGVDAPTVRLLSVETQYQWISSAWTPKELVHGPVPLDAFSPGAKCKPIHTDLQDLLYGVRVRFTPQGGATPANNEFLGRIGQLSDVRADGATTVGSSSFTGSGFSLGQNGAYLYIHDGADAGLVRIATVRSGTSVILKNLDNTVWTSTANAGGLSYTIWEAQASPGPECASAYLAHGYGKDNTQNVGGIFYEFFQDRTLISEGSESTKFCLPVVGPAGSTGPSVYYATYPVSANQYAPGIPQNTPIPGAPLANGTQLLDACVDKTLDGTNGRVDTRQVGWSGNLPSTARGFAISVDFGTPVEVGQVVVRCVGVSSPPPALFTETQNQNGTIAHLHAASLANATTASTTQRMSAVNGLNTTTNNKTVSLTTGDFLGAVLASGADGVTVAGTNTLSAALGTFLPAHVGAALNITSGADVGATRIVSVAVDGGSCTIRNLDQSAKLFTASASGLSFEIRDAVREDDVLVATTGSVHKLCVERLLTTTSAQVRIPPGVTLTNTSWEVIEPAWTFIKRFSHSTQAVPPDVTANGTFVSTDGRERNDNTDFKFVADLSDLAAGVRTAQVWKFSAMPRFNATLNVTPDFNIASITFYDTTGKVIGLVDDHSLDTVNTQANFLACHVSRVDFIQAASTGTAQIAGVNGLATLGGAASDVVTLAASNRFLGFQVGYGDAASAPGGSNVLNFGGTDTVNAADLNRIIWLASGPNAGPVRVASVVSPTQVLVSTPGGNPLTLLADAGPTPWTIHEGFQVGTNGDLFVTASWEAVISAVSDDLRQLTLADKYQPATAGATWEIRRRALPSSSTVADATLTARILYTANTVPVQSGDICQDSRGFLQFHPLDAGASQVRTDGETTVGSGVFTGSKFTPDDVGRVLVRTDGTDAGAYRISAYTSATQVTVVNLYTGDPFTFSASETGRSYYVVGKRRFQLARYVTVLRS